jgi:hypothetical protein
MGEKTISITVLNPGPTTDNRILQVALSNSSGGLAKAQAVIEIRGSNSSGGGGSNPPVTSPPVTGGASNGGGGAIGIESWLLMVLGMFRIFTRRIRATHVSRIAAHVR